MSARIELLVATIESLCTAMAEVYVKYRGVMTPGDVEHLRHQIEAARNAVTVELPLREGEQGRPLGVGAGDQRKQGLSKRTIASDIGRLKAEGKNVSQIARELNISRLTVRKYAAVAEAMGPKSQSEGPTQ